MQHYAFKGKSSFNFLLYLLARNSWTINKTNYACWAYSYIYMNIEMVHQYILLVTDAYLVGRNEMFSKMNIKILMQWLHKT